MEPVTSTLSDRSVQSLYQVIIPSPLLDNQSVSQALFSYEEKRRKIFPIFQINLLAHLLDLKGNIKDNLKDSLSEWIKERDSCKGYFFGVLISSNGLKLFG